MFKSIKMAHFNENGKQIQEPKGRLKMNIVRRFGGWMAKFYPILKLRYFKESNTWKNVDAGAESDGGLTNEKQLKNITHGLANFKNIATTSKEWSGKLKDAADQASGVCNHSCVRSGSPSLFSNKEELECKTDSNDIMDENSYGNKREKTNSMAKMEAENKSSRLATNADRSSDEILPKKSIGLSNFALENALAFKRCCVELSRLSDKQVQEYLGLDTKCAPSEQAYENPSRSLLPHNRHKRWKAWCQSTSKPTICGAHISSEATSSAHKRHNKKQILLRAVKLDKPLLLENSLTKRSYHRKSPNKSKLQPDHVKLKIMRNNFFKENWIKDHCISDGKENSPACKPEVRKSKRITAKTIRYERLMQVKSKILSKCEHGIKMAEFEDKGRGVVTTRAFSKGEFVVEYSGELTSIHDALKRERLYEDDETIGCYMYFFMYNSTRYCVDATDETVHLGRLINHSRLRANLVTRIVPILGRPHLALEAKVDLEKGTELLLDYGDRSRQALENHPWLRL